MHTRALVYLMILCTLACVPARAHHSFAMFDRTRSITIVGTVKEFQWTNPHVWVEVMVPNKAGVLEQWGIETGPINALARRGWSRKSVTPGEKVSVLINPMRDGSNGGSLITITLLASGKKLAWDPSILEKK